MSLGAPVDPAYTHFIDHLRKVVTNPRGTDRWRWNGSDARWDSYDVAQWVLEDVGLPDTPPERAIREQWRDGGRVYELSSLFVPELFERLRRVSAAHATRLPSLTLVWSPWGNGDWRSVLKRAPGGGSVPPPPPTDLPPKCVSRIEEVREYERRGFITHDQAQATINAIVAECT